MKMILPAIVLGLVSTAAHADLILPATLDLTCTKAQGDLLGGSEIRIESNAQGSIVTLDGKAFKGAQLIGGTEGGPAYLQAVNNEGGYNITISGGDFDRAVMGATRIEKGAAKASVNLFTKNENFNVTCVGLYDFTRK